MNVPFFTHTRSSFLEFKASRHASSWVRNLRLFNAQSACLSSAIVLSLGTSLAQAQGGYVRPSLIQGNSALINHSDAAASVRSKQQSASPEGDQRDTKQSTAPAKKTPTVSIAKAAKQTMVFPYKVKDWEVTQREISGDEGKTCVARSPGMGAHDGLAPSAVIVEVDHRNIRVLTDAEIDAYQKSAGLRIDSGTISPFDEVVTSTNIKFSLEYLSLIKKMRKGQQADLVLGFWPSQTQTAPTTYRVSLRGFSLAMEKLTQCRKALSQS